MGKSVDHIKNDKFSGSFKLSQRSLLLLSDFIEESGEKTPEKLVEAFSKYAKAIIKAQPNMVAIRKKVTGIVYHTKRLLKAGKSIDEIKLASKEKIENVMNTSDQNRKKIGRVGAKLILNNSKILTISASSLVKEIFMAAHKMNRKFTVYCLESRPQNEGHVLAEELSDKGIACVLMTDAMMAQALEDANMIITGADRISESGFVNKSGTLPLAIASKTFQVPLFLAAETDKILKEIDRSVRFYPQDRNVIYSGKNKTLTVLNYYFESISFDYVGKVICEDGVFDTNEFITWYLKD